MPPRKRQLKLDHSRGHHENHHWPQRGARSDAPDVTGFCRRTNQSGRTAGGRNHRGSSAQGRFGRRHAGVRQRHIRLGQQDAGGHRSGLLRAYRRGQELGVLLDTDIEGRPDHRRRTVHGRGRFVVHRHRRHRQVCGRQGQHETASARRQIVELRLHLRSTVMAYTLEHCLRSRQDFPALIKNPDLAFLDGPGGSQVPRVVVDAIADVYASCNVNTHGNFAPSREVDRRMEVARSVVATFLGAEGGSCISFGQSMTTLNFNLSAAIGRTLEKGDEVLITQLDHEGNRGPWLNLQERGVVVREVRLLESGELDPADMADKITSRTKLFAIGASANSLGTVNDLALARRLTRNVGALLVIDAVHYAPHFPIDVQALGADFLLCSGYKFYGPHVGVLYSRPGALDRLPTDRLSVQDPNAPYRIETGTLNHAAIDGTRAAVEYLASWGQGGTLRERVLDAMSGISAYEHELATFYHDAVRKIPGVRVYGPDLSSRARAPTVSITHETLTAGQMAQALGQEGICVWDGNFYAVRAVEVLGLAARGGLLRTGISMYTGPDDLERLLAGLNGL